MSRALNDSNHAVNKDTRGRIISLAREWGYRPNAIARGLRTDRTFTVGIIADSISSVFTPIIIRGIQDQLSQRGYLGLVINGDRDRSVETEAIHQFMSRSIDGVIFVESWLRGPNPTIDLAGRPYVFVQRLFGSAHPNSVVIDDRHGAHLAVEHLAKIGHRRIAFINGPKGWDASANRLDGYGEALNRAGLAFNPELLKEGDWEVQSGYRAAKKLLTLPQPPTAIFAANDLMALGAIYAIEDSGMRVPEDIAVVGYNDREIASISRPTITTVAIPFYDMGRVSAKLLLNLIYHEVESGEPIKMRGKLIVRESCGAVKGH